MYKSYFLNQLIEDFTGDLNKDFIKPIRILHFGFEMSPEDEIIRTASRKLKTSYDELLSLEKKIDPQLYERFKEFTKTYRPPIDFASQTGTLEQITETMQRYKEKYYDHKIIFSIDHILLVEESRADGEIVLMGDVINYFIKTIDDDSMVIILSQLNADIEETRRIERPSLHYPKKKDIHGSKKLYHGSDAVIVIHQPALLDIEYYGPTEVPTTNLVAFHLIKYRFGKLGWAKLWSNLSEGVIENWDENKLEQNTKENFNYSLSL